MAKNFKILLLKKEVGTNNVYAYAETVNRDVYDLYIDLAKKQGSVDFATILEGIQSGDRIYDEEIIEVVSKILDKLVDLFKDEKQFAEDFASYSERENYTRKSNRIKNVSKRIVREDIMRAKEKEEAEKKEAVSIFSGVISRVAEKKAKESKTVETEINNGSESSISEYEILTGEMSDSADSSTTKETEEKEEKTEATFDRDYTSVSKIIKGIKKNKSKSKSKSKKSTTKELDKTTDSKEKESDRSAPEDNFTSDTKESAEDSIEPEAAPTSEPQETVKEEVDKAEETKVVDNAEKPSVEQTTISRLTPDNIKDLRKQQLELLSAIREGKLTADDLKKLDAFKILKEDIDSAQKYNHYVNELNKDLNLLKTVDPKMYEKGNKGKFWRIIREKIGGLVKRHPGVLIAAGAVLAVVGVGLFTVDLSGFTVLLAATCTALGLATTGITLSWTVGGNSRKKSDFNFESRVLFTKHREKAVEKLDEVFLNTSQMYDKKNVEQFLAQGENKSHRKAQAILKNKKYKLDDKNYQVEPKRMNSFQRFGRLMLKPFYVLRRRGKSLQTSLNGMEDARIGMVNSRDSIKEAVDGLKNKQGRRFRRLSGLRDNMIASCDVANNVMDTMLESATSMEYVNETTETLMESLRALEGNGAKKIPEALKQSVLEKLNEIVGDNRSVFEGHETDRKLEKENTYEALMREFQGRGRARGKEKFDKKELKHLERHLSAAEVEEIMRKLNSEKENAQNDTEKPCEEEKDR